MPFAPSASPPPLRRLAWPVALAAAAVFGTLATACMMPFVGLAVAAAATMPRPRAAATIAGSWAINQALGFALLGYPPTGHAVAWGLALGLAALAAMPVAAAVLARRPDAHPDFGPDLGLRLAGAFLAAFATFEGGLFLFACVAGGTGTFAPAIVVRILANDGLWFAALIALHIVLVRAAPRLFGAGLSLRAA